MLPPHPKMKLMAPQAAFTRPLLALPLLGSWPWTAPDCRRSEPNPEGSGVWRRGPDLLCPGTGLPRPQLPSRGRRARTLCQHLLPWDTGQDPACQCSCPQAFTPDPVTLPLPWVSSGPVPDWGAYQPPKPPKLTLPHKSTHLTVYLPFLSTYPVSCRPYFSVVAPSTLVSPSHLP